MSRSSSLPALPGLDCCSIMLLANNSNMLLFNSSIKLHANHRIIRMKASSSLLSISSTKISLVYDTTICQQLPAELNSMQAVASSCSPLEASRLIKLHANSYIKLLTNSNTTLLSSSSKSCLPLMPTSTSSCLQTAASSCKPHKHQAG